MVTTVKEAHPLYGKGYVSTILRHVTILYLFNKYPIGLKLVSILGIIDQLFEKKKKDKRKKQMAIQIIEVTCFSHVIKSLLVYVSFTRLT